MQADQNDDAATDDSTTADAVTEAKPDAPAPGAAPDTPPAPVAIPPAAPSAGDADAVAPIDRKPAVPVPDPAATAPATPGSDAKAAPAAADPARPDAAELERKLKEIQQGKTATPPAPGAPAAPGASATAPGASATGTTAGGATATPTNPAAPGAPGAPVPGGQTPPVPGAPQPNVAGAGATGTAAPGVPGASTPTADQLRDALGKTGAAAGTAGAAGAAGAADAVPETRAAVTEAAKQAATETAPPSAAALSADEAAAGDIIETLVTKENARSSSEDFETSVRDALTAGATGATAGDAARRAQDEAENDDDDNDNSDLAKIALAGVAGLVVGQMLSNNRQVALNTGDRVIVTRPDGSQEVIKNDNALLLRPGATVQTENFQDGSTRTSVLREDGSRVVTIRDADLRVLRRSLVRADGTVTTLIDDTVEVEPVDVADLPPPARPVLDTSRPFTEDELRQALQREVGVDRRFTLSQIRNIPAVRALVAPVDIQAITFDTGSAAIVPEQAQQLSVLGNVIADAVRDNPKEIFIVEGHTDTVGSDAANLALSDRRAESVALALTEYFQVPPENMVVQGYGEQILRVPAEGDVRENRRASIRRITDLLAQTE